MPEDEVIPAHKGSWNQRELFHRILSRYCYVLEDIGGRTPTFLVSEKEDEDMHVVLETINQHLKALGYSARLYPDDPWILQLIPDPKNQWPSPRFILSMWMISLLTTVYAGEKWMSSGRPSGGWFVENASLDALLGYTLPIFAVLVIASFTQKTIAARSGVHLPHLFPLPGPGIIWWPFGIIGFASLPRSDARLWPDRSSMGNSALSVPLVMIIFGMILAFVGLNLTPDVVPLTAAPFGIELPLLVNLLGLNIEGDSMILKSAWAHPFTRAGLTLTFFGWIALLPIPTFPGGRILIARMGIPEARSGSTQVMLLLVVLLFAFLFGAFSEWSLWVPVVALCASLLITKGSDPRLPIVLDDFKGLPDSDHRRIGMILFMAFMFALPSQIPFYEIEDWDQDLSWSVDEQNLVIEDGWFNQTIVVSNPSLIAQDWIINLHGGLFGNNISLDFPDCDSGTNNVPGDSWTDGTSGPGCYGTVNPSEEVKMQFNFAWNESWNSTALEFIWNIGDELLIHNVIPDQTNYPVGEWQFNGDLDDPRACIELHVGKEESINLPPLSAYSNWDEVNATGNITVEKGQSEICIDSLSGDDMTWLYGHTFYLGEVPYKAGYNNEYVVTIPSEGVDLTTDNLMFSQSILALNHEGNCLDLGTPSPPLQSENGTRKWNLSIVPLGINQLTNSNDSIRLFAPVGSNIVDCEQSLAPMNYSVINGPPLIVGEGERRTQHWLGTVEITDGQFIVENPTSQNISLNIEFDGNGPQWNISNDIYLGPGLITTVSAIAPETGISFSWFELNDDEVILHLANHEV